MKFTPRDYEAACVIPDIETALLDDYQMIELAYAALIVDELLLKLETGVGINE